MWQGTQRITGALEKAGCCWSVPLLSKRAGSRVRASSQVKGWAHGGGDGVGMGRRG